MAHQVQCPNCGMFKVVTTQIQTIEPSPKDTAKMDPKQESRWVLIVLLLSLTIIGLPIAYWLCKQLEKAYPVCVENICRYSYKCSVCGYTWAWRTDEPLPASVTKNSLQRHQDTRVLAPPSPKGAVHSSFFHDFVAWWFRV